MKTKINIFRFIFLGPITVIYSIIISIRNFCFEHKILKSKEFDMPIISIGNISVGGTGKTPHTEYLLQMLKDDFSVAVLSRGYKRKSKGFRIVETSDTYLDAGDEPLQIKLKFPDAIVAVSNNRVVGIDKLREMYPDLNLIILDDAFQHRKVTPGLSILLNNYNHPISEDYMLPLGMLREPRSSSLRSHIIIYSKCPHDIKPIERRILSKEIDMMPFQYLYFSALKYLSLKPVFNKNIPEMEISELLEFNVLVLSGIARSGNFTEYLESKTKTLKHLKYPDHYNFKKQDILKIQKIFSTIEEKKIIIVTEKDAVRLKNNEIFSDENRNKIYYIPIEIDLLGSDEENKQFKNQILSYVRNNKRYSKLYKNSYSG